MILFTSQKQAQFDEFLNSFLLLFVKYTYTGEIYFNTRNKLVFITVFGNLAIPS